MTNIERIGENVRFYRQKKGLSQEQLALQSEINTSYIGQIERGEKNPTIKTLEKIAAALNITLIDIISPFELRKGGEERSQHQQFLALLTPEDIKRYMIGILKDESNRSSH
ncbi:helix-turn-helix transcriptional regulator [Paenibacillus algorifonticola]|uniref:helix-turn-helix domain-containing protein n=1 Tax=Paenibacillus algorifonticola TaxID=684063 RepID=UPI003D2674E4